MIPQKVQEILARHRLQPRVFPPGSTPTSPLAAKMLGVEVGQIAKSLLFVGKDSSCVLVVLAGDRRISNPKLKALMGVKSRMATAQETKEATGFSPGGVCPFGVADIPIYIDRSLAAHKDVYPACGDDASGVRTSYRELLSITGGTPCDVAGEGAVHES